MKTYLNSHFERRLLHFDEMIKWYSNDTHKNLTIIFKLKKNYKSSPLLNH